MVKSDVQSTLTDPQSVIQREAVIFGELLAWGARKAIGSGFDFSRENFIHESPFQTFITIGRTAMFPMKSLLTLTN